MFFEKTPNPSTFFSPKTHFSTFLHRHKRLGPKPLSCTLLFFHSPDADGPNYEIFTGSSPQKLCCFKVLVFLPHAAFYPFHHQNWTKKTPEHSSGTQMPSPAPPLPPGLWHQHANLSWWDISLWHRVVPHTCRHPSFPPCRCFGCTQLLLALGKDPNTPCFASWLSETPAHYLRGFN